MHPQMRAQFDAMKRAHTPDADFVRVLESRIAAAPVVAPVSDSFPAQIKRVFEQSIRLVVPPRLVPAAERLTMLAIICGMTAGGWISMVSASYNTIPGDTLYNVKRATEKVQIAAVEVTGDTSKAAKLHADFAERRATEVQRVIAENKSPEQAKTAMALLTESVASASEALKEAQSDNSSDSTKQLETVTQVLSNTERIAMSLAAVLDTLPPNVSELIDELVMIQGTVTEQRLTALQEIVRAQLAKNESVDAEETKAIIIAALTKVSEESQSIVLRAKALDTTGPTDTAALMAVPPITTSTGETTAGAIDTTSTPAPDQTTSTTSTAAAQTDTMKTTDISAISTKVESDLKEVATLVESGSLIEALEKAKEVTVQQTEIEVLVKKAELQDKQTSTQADPAVSTTPSTDTESVLQGGAGLPTSTAAEPDTAA